MGWDYADADAYGMECRCGRCEYDEKIREMRLCKMNAEKKEKAWQSDETKF
jgi:hypothetical protein